MGTIKSCEPQKTRRNLPQPSFLPLPPPRRRRCHHSTLSNASTSSSRSLPSCLNEQFTFWKRKDKFISKFSNAADRMKSAFERNEQKCGYYDANNLPHGGPNGDRKRRELEDVERYNREDPWEGTKQ